MCLRIIRTFQVRLLIRSHSYNSDKILNRIRLWNFLFSVQQISRWLISNYSFFVSSLCPLSLTQLSVRNICRITDPWTHVEYLWPGDSCYLFRHLRFKVSSHFQAKLLVSSNALDVNKSFLKLDYIVHRASKNGKKNEKKNESRSAEFWEWGRLKTRDLSLSLRVCILFVCLILRVPRSANTSFFTGFFFLLRDRLHQTAGTAHSQS